MFSRVYNVFFFLFVFLPLLATATAIPRGGGGNNCNVGSVQCCNQVQTSRSDAVTTLASLLGLSLGGVTGQVGINCSPISVIGVGGNSCSAQPVCCDHNNFNGLINLGCSPINVNL